MANSYHQVYLQFVFVVKYREGLLDQSWRKEVFGVIGNLINETGCKTIIVNGVEDHVHCLVGLRPSISIADLMKSVKAKSSKYINDHGLTKCRFEWQKGYGVFSYGKSQVDVVYRYTQNQERHHQKKSFSDEFREFLEKFEVDYDEQFLFEELK